MEETVKHQSNLTTIPYLDCSTVTMIAQYYGVPKTLIRDRYHTHKEELDKRGVMVVNPKELEDLLPSAANYQKKADRCIVTYKFDNGQDVPIHVSKNWIFTKEAAEYMGTILTPQTKRKPRQKDNTESTPVTRKVSSKFRSEEEKMLCIKLAKAFASGDTLKLISAALDLDSYRLEQITELSDKLEESAQHSGTGIPWTSRASVPKIVKTISDAVNVNKNELMNKIYYKLTQDYMLPLEERRIMPLIDAVKDSEWHIVYQTIAEICEERMLDIRQVFRKAGVNAAGLSLLVNIEGGEIK